MKKLFYITTLFLVVGAFVPYAKAQTPTPPTCPTGQHSKATVGPDGFTAVSYACVPDSTSSNNLCVTINGNTTCGNNNPGTGGTATPGVTPVSTQTPNSSTNLGYVPLEPIPGLVSGSLVAPGSLPAIINAIFKIMITAGALMAVLSLTIGGIQYMTSMSAGGKNAGIKRAQAALWAILLIAATWLILNTINPNLLKFSLNPCPQGGTTCNITSSASNTGSTGIPSQTLQVSAQKASELGLVSNSVVLYNNNDSARANAAITQSMNECNRYSGGFSDVVPGTAVGGTANQSAEVCKNATFLQSMTNALGN